MAPPLLPFQFANTALPDVIELRGVTTSYNNGQVIVLENFNLLIEDEPNKGQAVGLMGPSGCGKSTVLRHIAGLQAPTSGEVLINGKPADLDMPISMVFQTTSLLDHYSVIHNIALPLLFRGMNQAEAYSRAQEIMDAVGLKGHGQKYARRPDLSGGQIRRAEIAQALIANPNILLLDEPNTGLDVKTKYKLQNLVQAIWQQLQCTIIMVEHIPEEAVAMCDTIYIMQANPGRIVKKIIVDLPFPRTADVLCDPRFIQLAQEVKTSLMELESPDE